MLEGTIPEHIEAEFNEELWDSEHAAWLQSASLVIGLHPDQASFHSIPTEERVNAWFCCYFHPCWQALLHARLWHSKKHYCDKCRHRIVVQQNNYIQ